VGLGLSAIPSPCGLFPPKCFRLLRIECRFHFPPASDELIRHHSAGPSIRLSFVLLYLNAHFSLKLSGQYNFLSVPSSCCISPSTSFGTSQGQEFHEHPPLAPPPRSDGDSILLPDPTISSQFRTRPLWNSYFRFRTPTFLVPV